MFDLLSIITGVLFGIYIVLVPGISLALPISILVGLGYHDLPTALFIASSSGASLFTKRLALVMHPNAQTGNLASLDPVMKMVAIGEGRKALDIMTHATLQSYKWIGSLGLLLALITMLGLPVEDFLKAWLGKMSIVIIPLWVLFTCARSKRPWTTLTGFILVGVFGVMVERNPWTQGGDNQIAPILVGLFGIPMSISALIHSGGQPRPLGAPGRPVRVNKDQTYTGILLGAFSGFLPGLGASSVISTVYSLVETEEERVLLASCAEAANDIMSVVLVLATGMTRSGEAVMLKACIGGANTWAISLVVLSVVVGSTCGLNFVRSSSDWYSSLISSFDQGNILKFVIGFSLIPVALSGGTTFIGQTSAWLALATGLLVAYWCKSNYLPNQVGFSALAMPVLCSDLGIHLNLFS